ncbi:MAG: diacylglycerol kinase family protein [Candidatus Nanopelagicales bacterium]|nr:diacylglycerol kinase family protein [Candidatus Nanopelagicales bacterium]MDZ4249502.1 diacylglycerol kinase family protein [Candidatus Nanopelagicales bacterium]
MRGLLVVNPNATTTTERVRDVLVHALSDQLDLEVVVTTRPGHARELGERALRERLDVVVTLGGDGTINEAVNGMLVDGPGPDVPALATVPGGSGNVLARSAGLPKDPVEATGMIMAGLREGLIRTISLGLANDRWFTMSAGMGLDAEIITAMESQRAKGHQATSMRYFATALREFFIRTDRRNAPITVSRPGEEDITGVYVVVIQNGAPWTFLGDVAMNPSPEASFDEDLDLFAVRDLRVVSALRWARRIFMGSRAGSVKGLIVGHDIPELTVTASRPTTAQVDGESLGEQEVLHVRSVPRALRIVV